MQSEEYKKYMKSDKWQKKKQERINIDKCCVMCQRPLDKIRSLQVHHITYQRLGDEDVLNDLVTLCGSCHKKIHNYYKRVRA